MWQCGGIGATPPTFFNTLSPAFTNPLSFPLHAVRVLTSRVWEGKDVIRQGRRIVGATNPQECEFSTPSTSCLPLPTSLTSAADPGSIRGQYAVSVGRNLIHAVSLHSLLTEVVVLTDLPVGLVRCRYQGDWPLVHRERAPRVQ